MRHWSCRGSIPVPLTCKASALPFELQPLPALRGIFPRLFSDTTDVYGRKKTIPVVSLESTGKTLLELPGIDPGTSHMLSERSTT